MKAPDLDIARLCVAMQRARLVDKRPRQEMFDAVREYVGPHWSEEGTVKSQPCNLLSLYISIVGKKLVSSEPRGSLSIWDAKAKPVVRAMQDWMNRKIQQIHLADTLEDAVISALFSIGIIKVCIASPQDAALSGWGIKAGEPAAWAIDRDDFVYDVHARKFGDCSFIGHRYRVPYRAAVHVFGKNRGLVPSDDRIYNLEGDERISMLGRTTLAGDATDSEFEPMIDLWEIYLPRERVVVTLQDDNLTGASSANYKGDPRHGKALHIQKWIGPDEGPYHILGFGKVPGNAPPKAPVQDLIDVHMSVNNILRKLLRQAARQKELLLGPAATDGDIQRINDASDGEAARCDQADKIVVRSFGGPNQPNFQLFGAMKEVFSWLGGNLNIAGGLSAETKTAHQDAMLNANSSASISEMQQRVVKWTTGIFRALCWYYHHHPTHVMRAPYQVPGLQGVSIPRTVTPEDRGYDFDDLDITIDAYSLQHQTPEQKLAAMDQLVMNILTPLAGVLAQQGIIFDVRTYLSKRSHWMNSPDVEELVTVGTPPDRQPGGGGGAPEQPAKPAHTSREYTRRSLGGTPEGEHNQLMQSLLHSANAGQNGEANGQTLGG